MPRARNIKPSFFLNDELAECKPLSRILFIGLWTIADRKGRLEYRPTKIKAQVLPYDNCKVEPLVLELAKRGFVIIYEVDNKMHLQINNFELHQNPHVKEPESTILAPDSPGAKCSDSGFPLIDSPLLIPDSTSNNARRVRELFDRFWEAYPRKASKKAAIKVFEKINPDEQLVETMISTIERAKTSDGWKREKGRFIPHPTTWLNGERWKDEGIEENDPFEAFMKGD